MNPKCKLFFDPQHPNIDERAFKEHDWFEFYRDTEERLPSDSPKPRGNTVSTHCFVDSDHAVDKVTRRSQTGILIFVNRAPILWYNKRQNTVETSTFGSEFIAMKTAVEQVESLWYKLRMFGVPLEGPTNMFCDNEAVFKNVSILDSTLKKKHTSICYHRCREAVASRTVRVAKEGTLTNLSDLFTKHCHKRAVRQFWIVLRIKLFRSAGSFTIQGDRIDLVGSKSWFRVVVPSDVFSSGCRAYAGLGSAIRRVRA